MKSKKKIYSSHNYTNRVFLLFIFVLIVVYYVHGYGLSLHSINIDTWKVIGREAGSTNHGRPLTDLMRNYISKNTLTTGPSLFVSVSLVFFSTSIFLRKFNNDKYYSLYFAIILTLSIFLNPLIVDVLHFQTLFAFFVPFALSVTASYLFITYYDKNKLIAFLLSSLLILISLNIYQAYIPVFIACSVFSYYKYKKNFLFLILSIFSLLVAFILYFLLVDFFEFTGNKRLNNLFDFNLIVSKISQAYNVWFSIYTGKIAINPLKNSLGIFVISIIIILFLLVVKNIFQHKKINFLRILVYFFILVLPVLYWIGFPMKGNPSGRTMMYIWWLIGICFFDIFHELKKIEKNIIIFFTTLIFFKGYMISGTLWTDNWVMYERDKTLINSAISTRDRIANGEGDIVFIGTKTYEDVHYSITGRSIFEPHWSSPRVHSVKVLSDHNIKTKSLPKHQAPFSCGVYLKNGGSYFFEGNTYICLDSVPVGYKDLDKTIKKCNWIKIEKYKSLERCNVKYGILIRHNSLCNKFKFLNIEYYPKNILDLQYNYYKRKFYYEKNSSPFEYNDKCIYSFSKSKYELVKVNISGRLKDSGDKFRIRIN